MVSFPNFGYWRVRLGLFFNGRMPTTQTLPYSWFDTPNIHLCTVRDFEALCEELGLRILDREIVDSQHRSSTLMKLMPNLMGEAAVYRLEKA